MAILTTINGIPLYDNPQEALDYAAQNNLTGYHSHIYQGVVGYMGGITHSNAVTNLGQNTSPSSGTSGSGGSGGGGY